MLQASKQDIYDNDRNLRSKLRLLEKDRDILEVNKQNIADFQLYLASDGVSIGRRARYIWHLHEIAKILGEKQFIDCTERDVRQIVSTIESNPNWGEWTKNDFKVFLKRFFRWLKQYPKDENPPETKWIKLSRPRGRKLPEELVTEEEVKSLVEACADNIRDKAFIFTLYESGCRPGEILGLRRRNVIFDDKGAVLIVDGKTGPRRVRLVAATSFLANWMNEAHPFKDDPDSYLWVNLEGRTYGRGLKYHAASRILKRRCEQAKLNKRVYSYLFRHTRATALANIMTEAQMDEYLGWVQGSDMPSIYVHLSGKNLDPVILAAYGLETKESRELEKMKPKECHICKTINSPIGEFCIRCGRPLELEVALKMDEERQKEEAIAHELQKKIVLLEKNQSVMAKGQNALFEELARRGFHFDKLEEIPDFMHRTEYEKNVLTKDWKDLTEYIHGEDNELNALLNLLEDEEFCKEHPEIRSKLEEYIERKYVRKNHDAVANVRV